MASLAECLERDAADPLASCRRQFRLPPGVTYLSGHSLGCLPIDAEARTRDVVSREWAEGAVRSWHDADWLGLPARVGAKIADLIGARSDEVIVADSVSVNLFKIICSALRLRPDRKVVLVDPESFPTDLYVAESAARQCGAIVRRADSGEIADAIDETVALVLLTHVDYRSARVFDMGEIARAAHKRGALVAFDLAHTAGAIACDLDAAAVDFAVGCGYKYLNGGPGAPAFLYVAQRHLAHAEQPLTGWFAHEAPFDFDPHFRPAPGIARFLCGTPPILSLAALDAALDVFDGVSMVAVEEKSRGLTGLFMELFGQHLSDSAFVLRSESGRLRRGSHVAISHADGQAIMEKLSVRGFIGDFRAPDFLRFGFSPLYTRYMDVHGLVQALTSIVDPAESSRPEEWAASGSAMAARRP